MGINKIKIENFKTFDDLEVTLGKYNVLIGANAAGKSNFIQIFKFLRDISSHGLDNAIYMQGGLEFVRNSNISYSKNLIVQIDYESNDNEGLFSIGANKEEFLFFKKFNAKYRFEINFKKTRGSFAIIDDTLTVSGNLFGLKKKVIEEQENFNDTHLRNIGEGTLKIQNRDEKVSRTFESTPKIKQEDIFPPFLGNKISKRKILLEEDPRVMNYFNIFKDLAIFDFDPKLPKKAMPISGKIELAEDGGNLAIVLKSIMENETKRKKLISYVKHIMPFVDSIRVKPFSDKSLLFELKEIFNKNHLPASLISDGTINLTALIVALYFDRRSIIILEEPERNIHPFLISKVVKLIKEASEKKQIIVTTHNPEVIKYTDIKDLLLIRRDKNGYSQLSKPKDDKSLEVFIKNNIGIDELFIKLLLERGK
ncbi:MAG: AAA family ATPase [Methanoregula sp.]